MKRWFVELDNVLRGERTRVADLREGTIPVSGRTMSAVTFVLVLVYGLSMGSFALWRETGPEWNQLLASSFKMPMLFFLTLGITSPSLYVFNLLVGSRLTLVSMLRLLLASLAVIAAVAASLGPIVVFFGASTTSYGFMVLLNVAALSVSGILGMIFLLNTLDRLTEGPSRKTPPPLPTMELSAEDVAGPGPLEPNAGEALGDRVRGVFLWWVLVFGLVGLQMGWILRPFIGDPDTPFAWFRPRGSNFLEGIWNALSSLVNW